MKKSSELEKRITELEDQVVKARQQYADGIIDGREESKHLDDLMRKEAELQTTRMALDMVKQREAVQAEKERIAEQEKMAKGMEKLRADANSYTLDVIDKVIEAFEALRRMNDAIIAGNALKQNYALKAPGLGDNRQAGLNQAMAQVAGNIGQVLDFQATFHDGKELAGRFHRATGL